MDLYGRRWSFAGALVYSFLILFVFVQMIRLKRFCIKNREVVLPGQELGESMGAEENCFKEGAMVNRGDSYIPKVKLINKMEKIPKEFWEDMRWGQAHKSELMEKYGGEWVAIVNKKVVAAGKNLRKVKEEAMKITKKELFPTLFVESGAHIYKI